MYLNIKEISIIIGAGHNTIYYAKQVQEVKQTLNKGKKEYNIDIDTFLDRHKIFDFKFSNELENKTFIDRMIKPIDLSGYPDQLTTKNVRDITNFSCAKIKYMRDHNKLQYETFVALRYPTDSKGRIQYLYTKESLVNYLKCQKISIGNEFIPSKQFYSTSEALEYINKKNNLHISLKTLYRYIYNYRKIPAIKVGGNIKIPILEFSQLDFNELYKK